MVKNSALRTSPPRRVDRRRVRTRAALIEAGKALFAVRTPEGVTIDDIVAAADVAKGSFYNHFADKEAFARELAEQARSDVEALTARVTEGFDDPAVRVARALCGFARQAVEDSVGVRARLQVFQGASIPDAAMNAGVRADVARGLASGRFSGVSQETAVLLAVGVVQITVSRLLSRESPGRAATLAADMTFGLLRGLGLEPDAARTIADRAAANILADLSPPG